MDVNALGLLVEIIDAGNLSRAAARLGMSRANVSHRLSQSERDLGQHASLLSVLPLGDRYGGELIAIKTDGGRQHSVATGKTAG